MANVLPHPTRISILKMLCEGCSLRSASRMTGCHTHTIEKLIVNFGNAARIFLDETLTGLTLNHVQVDEMWTFVGKKQARLTTEERELRGDIGDVYLWLCVSRR